MGNATALELLLMMFGTLVARRALVGRITGFSSDPITRIPHPG